MSFGERAIATSSHVSEVSVSPFRRFAVSSPVLATLAGFKGAYLLSILAALCFWGNLDTAKFLEVNARWPREGQPVFASHFATWDGAHYLLLSEVGYDQDVPSCAFYPLWPLLVRWMAPLIGGSHPVAALLLSNALSVAGWALFHRIVSRRWGDDTAKWSLVFLIAFPGALFFQFNYSESLFFLLLMLLWLGLEEGRHGFILVASIFLPLTRGVGLFVVLPMAFYALQLARPSLTRFNRFSSINSFDLGRGSTALRLLLLAAPLAGSSFYLLLMWCWTGNPFEGFAAQRHWGAHSIWNLVNFPKFVIGFFTPTHWHDFTGSGFDRCAFILLLYALPVIWRLGKDMLVWTYVLGILPAMSGTFASFTRFESCAFPLFIALGFALKPNSLRWARYSLLALLGFFHIWLLWRFVNFRWAG